MGVLDVYGLAAGYPGADVLCGVGFGLGAGECVAVTGASGAGKTTLLRAVSGLVTPERGRVVLDGADVTGAPPERIAAAGLAHVLERRRIFAGMTTADNLDLGGWTRPRAERAATRERVLELFPRLRPWLAVRGGALPASEQGLLAIARGLMASPSVLLIDDPAAGLDADAVGELVAAMTALLAGDGPALLLAEARHCLAVLATCTYELVGGALLARPAQPGITP